MERINDWKILNTIYYLAVVEHKAVAELKAAVEAVVELKAAVMAIQNSTDNIKGIGYN